MNCKRCGKEIVGEIQRYCNECKRELRGEEPLMPTNSLEEEKYKEVQAINESKEEVPQEVIQDEISPKKEKKHRIFSFGYILLVIFIIILTFLASCVVGFSLGPVLPI